MTQDWVFDWPHARAFTDTRISFLNSWLPDLLEAQQIKTALDVGCGVGYFSRYLTDIGLQVTGWDGRPENVAEAQRRNPDVKFAVRNMEESVTSDSGHFDLVLCFGLLYHLQNPFVALRSLQILTRRVLLLETMIQPGSALTTVLLDEPEAPDQGLTPIVNICSEPSLVKVLYRAGFKSVYGVHSLPDHHYFRETRLFHRQRTILIAAQDFLTLSISYRISEPASTNPWVKPWAARVDRVKRIIQMPWPEKTHKVWTRLKALRGL